MTKETPIPFGETDEGQRLVQEFNRQARERKRAFIERSKHLGDALDATMVAIQGIPPGVAGNPTVYRSNRDGSYFLVAGKRGDVASTCDPQEVQARAKRRVAVPVEALGEYAIARIDLEQRIKDGGLFYTPEGYIEGKRYNPAADPPLTVPQGSTPSVAK